jgi:hypothetical protein
MFRYRFPGTAVPGFRMLPRCRWTVCWKIPILDHQRLKSRGKMLFGETSNISG